MQNCDASGRLVEHSVHNKTVSFLDQQMSADISIGLSDGHDPLMILFAVRRADLHPVVRPT
jgi:hypothetical protein